MLRCRNKEAAPLPGTLTQRQPKRPGRDAAAFFCRPMFPIGSGSKSIQGLVLPKNKKPQRRDTYPLAFVASRFVLFIKYKFYESILDDYPVPAPSWRAFFTR
jgi:hypothetical protein